MNPKGTSRRWKGVALAILAAGGLLADDAIWNQAAAGTTYDWTNVVNWLPNTTYPNGAGQSAYITNDIVGAQTIRLRRDITLGRLDIGDSVASNLYNTIIQNSAGETFALTFDSGTDGVAAAINGGVTGTPTVTLSSPLALNSDLLVSVGGFNSTNAPKIQFNGPLAMNGRTLTFTNGVAKQNQYSFDTGAILTGDGTIINNAQASVSVTGSKAFGGVIIANRGIDANYSSSFLMTNGGFTNAAEIVVNGYIANGNSQAGGSIRSGNNAGADNNPGQRWTTRRITLNGGSLSSAGQTAKTGTINDWQKGLEYVRDNVATVTLNNAYSHIFVGAGGNTTGTILNVSSLIRNPGSSLYLIGPNASNKLLFASNGTQYLKGTGGAAGTKSMSVVPWVCMPLNNDSAANPSGFGTYVEGAGFRILQNTEYTNSVMAGAAYNVSVTSVALTNDVTVNALRAEYVNAPGNNFGTNRTLTVASGGVFFQYGDKSLGISGNTNIAGTLNFGNAEGVVWVLSTTTNTIGAKITGTGGFTKTGTGVLTLTGANSYSGTNHVSGGTLRVGDGTYGSNLGSGNVEVHVGATLILSCVAAIADGVTVSVHRYGLFNGRIQLDAGVNETVKYLMLGGVGMPSGTYGATGSGAATTRDDYFTGTGVLTVTGHADASFSGTVIRVL